MKKLIASGLLNLWILLSGACAGQDPIISQFFASPVNLNPAFAGATKDFRASLNMRIHPLPDFSNVSTGSASVDIYVPGLSGGLGLVATSDHTGNLFWQNQIAAVYAYHLQLHQNWFLNFGVQGGVLQSRFNWSKLEFIDPGQAPPVESGVMKTNFSAGLLTYNDRFYIGMAAHNLTRPETSLFGDERVPMKYTAHAGATLRPDRSFRANQKGFDYFISPNIIFQHQDPFTRINYGLYFGTNSIMAGVWYRQDLVQSNTIIFLIGIIQGNVQIGYSYDHSLSGFTDAFHAVHEMSLSYALFSTTSRRSIYKILNCPAF